jgi:aryl-alcohol dehydrogenase-like predicted oxidoreductase
MSDIAMRYKNVGKSGLNVSAIGLGTMTYGLQISEADAINLIRRAFAAGINLLDTAPPYPETAPGKGEEIIGKAIKEDRHSFVVATKVIGLSRRNIMKWVEGSLRRLQTDYIDLYYAHAADVNTPIEETLRTFDDLVRQGKVRYIGCSNFAAWQLGKALWTSDLRNLEKFICVETPYNLLTRDIETELLPLCESEGIGVSAYNPLAGELLTGKHEFGKPPAEGRFTLPKYGPGYLNLYWSETNFKAVDRLKRVAAERSMTLAQFALAWILNHKAVTSVLSGITSPEQLKENILAVEIILSAEELRVCDEVWAMFRPPRKNYAGGGPPPGMTISKGN